MKSPSPTRKKINTIVSLVAGVVAVLLYFGARNPQSLFVFFNTLWVILLAVTVVFVAIGVMVLIGLKREAGRIIDIFLKGSLNLIDFIEFLKLLYARFVQIFKEFVIASAPALAVLSAATAYLGLLVLYKWYGKDHDVAYFTIGLTAAVVFIFGLINRPKTPTLGQETLSWIKTFFKTFERFFIDSTEIVLLLFFLTLDSTKLFFLPAHLNTRLVAQMGDYDLMLRGFNVENHFKDTLTLIIIAVCIELLRNIGRLVIAVISYYRASAKSYMGSASSSTFRLIKEAIQKAVGESKDELLRFITFTTVIMFVFLFFPRLKLLAVAVTAVANLALDFVLPQRLSIVRKGDDLLSRLFNRFFKI